MPEDDFERYKTNIASMDEDHWKMFFHFDVMRQLTSRESLLGEFEILLRHWTCHSSKEEDFMESIKYPYLVAHKVEHGRVSNMLNHLRSRMLVDFSHILPTLVDRVEEIVRHHMNNYDRLYAEYLADKEKS